MQRSVLGAILSMVIVCGSATAAPPDLVGRLAALAEEGAPALPPDPGGAVASVVPATTTEPAASPGPSYAGVDLRDLATRHYYNPFDGVMLDRNPYAYELTDDAESMLASIEESGPQAIGPGHLSSLRALSWRPGRLSFLAILIDRGRPVYRTGTFRAADRTIADLEPIALESPSLYIGLKDLTISLRGSSGRFVLVDPIGAGGYRMDESGLLMTPVMAPGVTRTPGRGFIDASRYRSTYMLASRTHPDYYEGLPFIRLRRFDRPVDEYAIHGPISSGGTYPVRWGLKGEKLEDLKMLSYRHAVDCKRVFARLAQGLIDDDTRLVRGRISNGCIRLRARDIRELHSVLGELSMGAPVTVSYRCDLAGSFHPFPWETRRFAIATEERDSDGLTVMFTGAIRNQAGRNAEALPFPDEAAIAGEEQRAQRSARALAARGQKPADYERLLSRCPAARAINTARAEPASDDR